MDLLQIKFVRAVQKKLMVEFSDLDIWQGKYNPESKAEFRSMIITISLLLEANIQLWGAEFPISESQLLCNFEYWCKINCFCQLMKEKTKVNISRIGS